MELLTILVALLAVIISLVSLSRTKSFNDKQIKFIAEHDKLVQLQKLQLDKEIINESKSEVFLSVYGSGSNKRLRIINSGNVEIENVNLNYIEQEGYFNPFNDTDKDEKLPIKQMSPNVEHNILLALWDRTPVIFEVEISWNDNKGIEHQKIVTVST